MLVVTGRFGFKTYDVNNPTSPVLLDESVVAPSVRSTRWASKPIAGSSAASGGYVCPLFTTRRDCSVGRRA